MSRRKKNILQGSFMGKKSYDVSSFNAPFTEPANGFGDTKLNEKGDNDADEEVKEDIKKVSFISLFRYADRKDKIYIFLGIILSVVCGVCVPVGVYIFSTFLQAMVDYAISVAFGNPQVDVFLKAASTFAIYYSVIGTAMIICTYAATVLMNLAAYRQIYRIRQEYLKAALNQDFEYFDMHDTGDFASKMTDDVVKLESGIGEKLGTFIYFQAAFVSSLLMALVLGWKLALLCLVVFPVALVLIGATGVISAKLSKKESVVTGKAGSIAEEVLSSIRTVYAFSGQEKDLARYQVPLAEARNINKKKAIFNGLINGFIFFAIFCSYAISFWFGFNLMINEPDNYNVFIMTTVLFCIMMATSNFGISTTIMQVFGTATGAGAHIYHLLENVPKINTFKNEGFVPDTLEGNIEFRNVDFFYPSRPTVQVLKRVSLNLKSGKSVALVGHSGCGKSTIVQLILRFYDTIEGQVLIDGRDVRELSVQWLRSQIGLVGQEPVLFNASIRDNIRHGRADATDVEIEAAARKANAHEFIMALQKGYDTFVGQRGTSLSGGQKQRIAIARALIRNPKILLLDEATSALDKTSEAEVQHALDKAKEGRTTLIVAHNLSTIRNVDMIYVFKSGELVETGNHEELLKIKGQYYDMIMLQGNPGLDPADNESRNSKLSREISVQSQNLDKSIGKEIRLEDDDDDAQAKIPYREVLAMNAPEWKLITIGSIAALASGVALPLFSVFMGSFLEAFTDINSDDTMNTVRNLTYIFVGIGAFSGLANFIMVYFYEVSGAYLTERLKYLMFKKFLDMEIEFYDDNKNSPGALGAKLSGESTAVQGATGIRIGTTLQAVGTFSIAIVIAMYFEWRVGLIALAFTPILIAIVYKEGKMVMAESYGAAKTMEKSSKLAVEAVANVRTVASLGREQYFIQTYSQQLRPALSLAERGAHWRGFIFGLSRGLPNYIATAAFYAGAMFIVYNDASFDNVFRSAQGLLLGSTSAAAAFAFSADYQKAIRAAMRVKSILNQQPKITDPLKPEVENFKGTGQASLQNVNFSYITRPEITVLDDFNLEIESGKTIALVGASGCGKSTVIQVIERYYDPNDGIVALDGIPLKSLRLNDVRYNLGFVQQEPILFTGTIAENISYGDNSRTLQMNEIIEAAQQANIHNFIVSLPKGYDTPLGSKGTQLSGGQKQRVAIARAFIRRPKLLLLDEATSALDVESEKVVQEALERAKAGRTCITIAHRLSTIRDSDVINVISKGRVVEKGKHDYLMNLKGHYYKLHQL